MKLTQIFIKLIAVRRLKCGLLNKRAKVCYKCYEHKHAYAYADSATPTAATLISSP